MRTAISFLVMLLLWSAVGRCQNDLDIEEVITGAYTRDSLTRSEIGVMMMEAESYSRSLKGDGEVKEEKKFLKNYYIKDTLIKAEFLEYYLDSELQDEKELQKQIKEARERREKGRNRDASINPMTPFYPENREHYLFSMPGVEKQHGCICYHVKAECQIEDEDLLEGDFWFEVNDLNLVHAEFHPAKMPSKIKQLDMKKSYAPVEYGYWLPVGFHLRGRGKVMIFIKFNFEVEERYSKHKINVEVPDDFFVEESDEN
jgi:hypothetical protein